MLGTALTLVRAAAERPKPNAQRLPEFTDQALPRIARAMATSAPVFPDLQEVQLAFGFSKLREVLGTDDPLVKSFLGSESPDQLAHRLVAGTKLADPAVRKALYDGGGAAIAASSDPMIVFARAIDPPLRALRKEQEDRITAPSRAAAERIANARFAVYGTSIDPDATFTLRLSYGTVKGFANPSGAQVPPYTTIGGLFGRATGAAPYVLPKSWLDAKSTLDLATPMNLSTTNDIIGGNSASPLVERARRGRRADLRRQHLLARRRLRLRCGAQPVGRGRQPRAARGVRESLSRRRAGRRDSSGARSLIVTPAPLRRPIPCR